MARTYNITDTAAEHGAVAACSGTGAGPTTSNLQIEWDGNLGVGTRTCEPGLNQTTRTDHFESPAGGTGVLNWGDLGAGNNDWVVNREVATARACTWNETYVCERLPDTSFQTVVSETAQGIALSSTGIKTHTLEANDYTAGNLTSQVYIVCVDTGPACGNDAVLLSNSTQIITPIAAIVPQAHMIHARFRR
jgi:hypothetical protein